MSTSKLSLLMAHSESSAVGLYRVWRPAKHLRLLGWDARTLPEGLPTGIPVERTKGKVSWEDYSEGIDLLSVQRSDNPEMIALALAMADLNDCPIVFEIDDNIYDVSESSPAYQWFHPGSPYIEVVETFMRNVTAITTTTPALAEVYSKLNPNIYILPNAQDPDEWKGIVNAKNDHLTIGWAGGYTHYDDLYMVRRPLKRILRKYPDVRFKVVGMVPDFLVKHPQVEIVKQFVSVRQYPGFLASLGFDIGLAPVVDRPFNRGKTNIKWQEYSMLEVPTVASRVGEYKEIEPDVTGFLANSEAEWEFYLEQLIKDAQLRKTIGRQAKRYTLKHNNIKLNIKQHESAYKKIIADYRKGNNS